jgi:hypothetical protein
MRIVLPALLALLMLAPPALADGSCRVEAVIAGEKVAMTHCAVALRDNQGLTLFFSASPIGAEEREAFEFNSYAKSKDPSGKERTMMHAAFCPGGGTPASDPARVKSVELSLNLAGNPLAFRQWVFDLPQDKGLRIERLTGSLEAGGRFAGRMTGSSASDGEEYSWQADFDLILPSRNAAAGPGCPE